MQVATQRLPLTPSLKEKAGVEKERGEKATHLECAESLISMSGYREPKKAQLALSKGVKGNKKGICKYQEKIDF